MNSSYNIIESIYPKNTIEKYLFEPKGFSFVVPNSQFSINFKMYENSPLQKKINIYFIQNKYNYYFNNKNSETEQTFDSFRKFTGLNTEINPRLWSSFEKLIGKHRNKTLLRFVVEAFGEDKLPKKRNGVFFYTAGVT